MVTTTFTCMFMESVRWQFTFAFDVTRSTTVGDLQRVIQYLHFTKGGGQLLDGIDLYLAHEVFGDRTLAYYDTISRPLIPSFWPDAPTFVECAACSYLTPGCLSARLLPTPSTRVRRWLRGRYHWTDDPVGVLVVRHPHHLAQSRWMRSRAVGGYLLGYRGAYCLPYLYERERTTYDALVARYALQGHDNTDDDGITAALLDAVPYVLLADSRECIAATYGFRLARDPFQRLSRHVALYHAYSRTGGVCVVIVSMAIMTQLVNKNLLNELDSGYCLEPFVTQFGFPTTDRQPNVDVQVRSYAPSRSVADLVAALDDGMPLRPTLLSRIARDCVTALRYLRSKDLCYGDLQPSTIMLPSAQQQQEDDADYHKGQDTDWHVVLVDMSGLCLLDRRNRGRVHKFTPRYCLDSDPSPCEALDWVCLGTTLAELAGVDIAMDVVSATHDGEPSSAETLAMAVTTTRALDGNETLRRVIVALLLLATYGFKAMPDEELLRVEQMVVMMCECHSVPAPFYERLY